MGIEDRQVRVLAHFDGPHSLVESQFTGGIQRDGCQGTVGMHIPVSDRLGRFLVQVTDQLSVVALDHHVGTSFGEQGCVVRCGVVGFDLVGPPVRECAATGSVSGNLRCDLVPLENVL